MGGEKAVVEETTQQWVDTGSGPGHMQTVRVTKVTRADAAYRRFLAHTSTCKGSCRTGVNCPMARALSKAWRDARNEARP
jgi:hypothetical protein